SSDGSGEIAWFLLARRYHGGSPETVQRAKIQARLFGGTEPWFYFASLSMLILFVISYLRLSKPINQIQSEAAQHGESLNNGRELRASWDRSLIIRVPLLVVSLLAQCLVLLVASA